jgi:hypothetical protein
LAHRRCVGCERPVCRWCRFGYGWEVRCPHCPAAVILEYRLARREEERARQLRCPSCGDLLAASWARIFDAAEGHSIRVRIWTPLCGCALGSVEDAEHDPREDAQNERVHQEQSEEDQ